MEKSFLSKLFSRPPKTSPAGAVKTDHGDAEVQFSLGVRCASDPGPARDYVQAAEWYRKAADQNHPLAQFNLGTMYAQGQGVVRDDAESAHWFGRAAHLGDAGAQFHLGSDRHRASFSEDPSRAVESRIEAYKWYRLAAAQGYRDQDPACNALIAGMTRADVTIGNERIADFKTG
jgi:hypothetical protein